MSAWDPYVDQIISYGQGSCDQACFIGLDGTPYTPNNDHLPHIISIENLESMNIAMNVSTGDDSFFHQNGVVVAGVKYELKRGSDDGRYFATKDGQGGLIFQKTQQAIAIAHIKEGGIVTDTIQAVTNLCEELEGSGW